MLNNGRRVAGIAVLALLFTWSRASAQNLRSLGIDVSAWQGNITAANWATLKRATNVQLGGIYGDGRDFVLIRSSRGGTTGYYDQNDANNVNGKNTLSQRYDDPYYVQNINFATSNGLFAGSYHFARPDIIASTMNSGGIANTGSDEADHMIQMAGPWIRPGYLLPVLDLESGQSQRTSAEMTTFCIDFANRINEVMGIRPMIYINGNYAGYVQSSIVPAIPNLWSARWPNQSNPNAIDVQNGNPKDSYTPIYGPWDDPPYPAQPWKIWQYASTAHVNAIGNGTASCDVDVAQGGVELLKDLLVPAVWMNDTSGQWTTVSNWNSGMVPVAPVQGTGQVARVGPMTLPTPRVPSSNDTVILDRPGALTVTLSSGTQNIRKLYARETLNITGGSLNIGYVPSWDSTPIAAQFSAPVTLSGANSGLSVHTLQVDQGQTFTVSGGTLAFNSLLLMPSGATPAKLALSGNVNVNTFSSTTATIANGSGSGTSGSVDLAAGTRTLTIGATTDLAINVPIVNGALTKAGTGTMRLTAANNYAGGTVVTAGKLLVNNSSGSGTGSGSVTVIGGILGGSGIIGGAITLNSAATLAPGPGSTIGALTLNGVPFFNGTNLMKIDRNGGSPLSDKLILTSGTLNYGGTVVVSNIGAAPAGGESFTLFSAPSYSGSFTATKLPALNSGLNWFLGDLAVDGKLKVNRSPIAGSLIVTNIPGGQLAIAFSSLTAGASDPDGDTIALTGINLLSTNGVTITTNGGTLYYASGMNAADQILYKLGDGRGGSVTGAVTIVPSTAGQFAGSPSVSGNAVSLRFFGGPGLTYYVERSTNLPPAWTTISTNVMPTSGVLDYMDDFHDLAAPPLAAFYRLWWVQ
jgi:autotransporter-associated beta strand protein